MSDTNYDVEITTEGEASDDDNVAEVTITGTIPWDELQTHREAALETVGASVEIDGFRQGKIPEDVLLQHVDEMHVIQEMAQRALSRAYPQILQEHEIDAIGRPEISITKIAKGQPLEFKATTAIMPNVQLPDYAKIAAQVNEEYADQEPTEVTDEEVQEAVNHIRGQWARAEKLKEQQAKNDEGDEPIDPQDVEVSDEELPELTDEFVARLGEYDNVAEFKGGIRENLASRKLQEQEQKQRGEIVEKIIDSADVSIPRTIVQNELQSMIAQFEADVKRSGLTLEDYLEQTEQTRDDLEEKWRPDARKRAKTQLILAKIAGQEEIQPDPEAVDAQVTQLMAQYDDADEDRARMYVESQLANEAVMKFLTEQE